MRDPPLWYSYEEPLLLSTTSAPSTGTCGYDMPGCGHPSLLSGHSTDFADTVVMADASTCSCLARSATARSIVACSEASMPILTAGLAPSVAGVALPGATTTEPRPAVRPGDAVCESVTVAVTVVSGEGDAATVADPVATEPGVVATSEVAVVTVVADEVVAVELPQLAIVNTELSATRAMNVECIRMPRA